MDHVLPLVFLHDRGLVSIAGFCIGVISSMLPWLTAFRTVLKNESGVSEQVRRATSWHRPAVVVFMFFAVFVSGAAMWWYCSTHANSWSALINGGGLVVIANGAVSTWVALNPRLFLKRQHQQRTSLKNA